MAVIFDNQGIGETVKVDGAASTGELPVVTPAIEIQYKKGSFNNNSVLLHTVTAGKTLHLVGIHISANVQTATNGADGGLLDVTEGAVLYGFRHTNLATYGMGGINMSIAFPLGHTLQFAAAEELNAGGTNSRGEIWIYYYEV